MMARRAAAAMAIVGVALGAHAATPTLDLARGAPRAAAILDVDLNGVRLDNRVRTYSTPDGDCLVFGDVVRALDLPIRLALDANVASGFNAQGGEAIEIDLEQGTASIGKSVHALGAGDVREVSEGWCVKGEAVARWLGVSGDVDAARTVLTVSSEAPLPVEAAMKRRQAARAASAEAAQGSPAAQTAEAHAAPLEIRLPYRLWKADAEGHIVSVAVDDRLAGGEAERVPPAAPAPVALAAADPAVLPEKAAPPAAPRPEKPEPEAAALADAQAVPRPEGPGGDRPDAEGWVADPDTQFLLDVDISRLRLAGGVRAYDAPGGNCVVFDDFVKTLDVPIAIDAKGQSAKGWAFVEENRIAIDRKARSVEIKGKRESFAKHDILDVPEGWCVDSRALARWFGISVEAKTSMSLLLLKSDQKLPVELAVERRNRANGLAVRRAALSTDALPEVKIPYRMWRAPALDITLGADVARSGDGSIGIGHQASITGAGEIGGLSFASNMSLSLDRGLNAISGKLFRSDPDAGLLGPLRATHLAIGDVVGRPSALGLGGNGGGLGATLTNRPLFAPSTFDRTTYEGELPTGWEAELYRNGALVAFDDDADGDGRYLFKDVTLSYGDNEIEVVLYGPQGQVRHDTATTNVGRDNVPPGKLWYFASVRQQGRQLRNLILGGSSDEAGEAAGGTEAAPGALELEGEAQFGVSKSMSVGALVRSFVSGDERVTYVEGSIRRSLGAAQVEIAAAADQNGGRAARARAIAKLGSVTLTGSASEIMGFGVTSEGGRGRSSDQSIAAGVPLTLGKMSVPLSLSAQHRVSGEGDESWLGALSLGARIGRFNLGNSLQLNQQRIARTQETSRVVSASTILSTVFKGIRLRGGAAYDIAPNLQFRSADLSASWAPSPISTLDGTLSYDAQTRAAKLGASYSRQYRALTLSARATADSHGGVGVGVGLNFSIDPANGRWKPTASHLALQGQLEARVFEDLNENGRYDASEPLMKNAYLLRGNALTDKGSDEQGRLRVDGLSPYAPTPIAIDPSSLSNPSLTPRLGTFTVTPRPGITAQVDIAMVGGGSVEAFLARDDGKPFEGLTVELIDEATGDVLATALSEIDGYILFDKVRYGTYRLRIAAESARVAGIIAETGASVRIDRVQPTGRAGTISLRRPPAIAARTAADGTL